MTTPPTRQADLRHAIGRAILEQTPGARETTAVDWEHVERVAAQAAADIYEPLLAARTSEPSQGQDIPDDQLDTLDRAIREGADDVYEAARRELKTAYRIGYAAALGYEITVDEDGRVGVGDRPEHAHTYGMACPIAGCRWPLPEPPVTPAADLADEATPDRDDAEALDRLAIGLANRGIFVTEATPLAVANTALDHIDRLTTALNDAALNAHEATELEAVYDGLDVDQEIRARALDAATRLMEGRDLGATAGDEPTVRDVEISVIGTADRYAEWVATGTYEWQQGTREQRAHVEGYREAVRRLRDAPMAEASREGFAAYLNGIAPDPGASIPAPAEERADA